MDNKHHHIVFKKRCEVAFLSKIFTLPGQIYSICWESTILNINVRTVDHVWLLGNMNVACSKSKPLLCGIVSYLFKKLSTSESLWLEFPSWLSLLVPWKTLRCLSLMEILIYSYTNDIFYHLLLFGILGVFSPCHFTSQLVRKYLMSSICLV